MTESDETSRQSKEILVALDHSHHSRAALESAAAIAQLMQAKVHGIFVHDDRWLRVSKLSSLFEIDELTGSVTPIKRNSVEQEIRSLERSIRDYFNRIVREHELSQSWSSTEGAVAEKVLEASKQADIISIGSRGRSYSRHEKIGSTALSIIQKANKPVLILQDRHTLGSSPILVFDGSEQSLSSLSIAVDIARENESRLTIIDISKAFPSNGYDKSDLRKELNNDVETQIVKLDQPDMSKFLLLVNKLRGGLLILPKNKRFTNKKVMEYILGSVTSPVLLSV